MDHVCVPGRAFLRYTGEFAPMTCPHPGETSRLKSQSRPLVRVAASAVALLLGSAVAKVVAYVGCQYGLRPRMRQAIAY